MINLLIFVVICQCLHNFTFLKWGPDVYLWAWHSSVCKLGGSCSDGREWFGLGVHIYVCNPPSDLLSNLTVNTTKNDVAHNKMMPQAALQREKKCYLLGMLLERRTAHNGPK